MEIGSSLDSQVKLDIYNKGRIIWFHNYIFFNAIKDICYRKNFDFLDFLQNIFNDYEGEKVFEVEEVKTILNRNKFMYCIQKMKVNKKSINFNKWYEWEKDNIYYFAIEYKFIDKDKNGLFEFYLFGGKLVMKETIDILFSTIKPINKNNYELSINSLIKISENIKSMTMNELISWDETVYFSLFYHCWDHIEELNKYRNSIAHQNTSKKDSEIILMIKEIVIQIFTQESELNGEDIAIEAIEGIVEIFNEFEMDDFIVYK